jgi:hypothetical protein
MKHKNQNDVAIMWQETNKRKRLKGKHKTNYNVKKGIEFNKGDMVFLGSNDIDQSFYWLVDDIKEVRQSTMRDYNYITTESQFIIEAN